MDNTKVCHWCGERKSINDYHIRRSAADGRQKYCKLCRSSLAVARNQNPKVKEKRAAAAKAYLELNREKCQETVRRRRARKRGRAFLVSTMELKRLYSKPCFYCSSPTQELDHVIALSRGGNHSIGNLLPSCRSCNASKGSKTIMEWRVWKMRLDSRA